MARLFKNKKIRKIINKNNINLRFNVLTVLVYIIGIILLVQLFNLQIVNGAEYREESNTRLSRESILRAARGQILDKTGNTLVSSDMVFELELYKTKSDTETLNNTIFNIIGVLEKYGISYPDSFPVDINTMQYTIGGEELSNWLANNKLPAETTAEQAFYKFKEKYDIKHENINDARKIMAIRYEINQKGYSSTKSIKLADNIPRDAVSEFNESSEKFPGINIVVKPIRTYTSGTLASHILGYAGRINSEEYEARKDTYKNDDLIGRTGIESVFEEYLKGKDGTKQIDMAVDGTTTAEYTTEEAVAGSNIVLTIDSNLQAITERALANNIEKIRAGGFGKVYNAKGGACVVMDVNTGEVLAMASYPDYDPSLFVNGISNENWSNYRDNPLNPLVSKATQVSYSPGSTYKMVSAIAGLQSGAINTATRINDTGVYSKYGIRMNCWYYTDYHVGHGPLNVMGAIEKSCNYFFYETGDRMGIDELAKYAKYFGLGGKTGIELPDEKTGVLASKEYTDKIGTTWNPGDTLNAVIGQGYNEFTPLQMAKYISMLANRGKHIDATIIKTVQNANGTEVSREELENFVNNKLQVNDTTPGDININPDYINTILEGMRSVTSDSGGTASNVFRDFGISVGGKTGSAETATTDVNAWFVGFAPFEKPEIAVVVMVENGGHGNYTAEAVREIMAEYFGMNTQTVQESTQAQPLTQTML